jgi:predicted DNA-binding transcriptional regulator AlpA
MQMTTKKDNRFRLMHRGEVLDAVGKSYPTIWKWMREGRFPRSVVIGGGVAWYEHEVHEWLASLGRQRLKGDEPEAA